jgi:Domain of unknown function (DUF927)
MQNHTLRPYLKLVAIAEDEATHEFLADIKFRDRDGNMRRVNLPLAELDNRKALVKTLTNLGAYFGTDQQANERALRKLIASKQKAKRINFAARVGWHGDGYHAFVLPNRVIGEARSKVPIRPPRVHSSGHAAGIGRRGTHDEWLRTVASHAKFSSRMVFAISAALAAPLLGMAHLPSFGILVHGDGKVGKSTMLVAAASVGGYGRERDLPNFRATDTAFGEIPAAFNDSLLPLNELGLLKGSTTEKYHRLRDFTYGFAEGRGTTYSKLVPIDRGSGGSQWLSISLATGEVTSNEIARDAGEFAWLVSRCAGLIWLRPETELPISLIASRKRCLTLNEQNGPISDAPGFARAAGVIMESRSSNSLSTLSATVRPYERCSCPCGRNSWIASSRQKMMPSSGTWQNVSATSTRLGSSVPALARCLGRPKPFANASSDAIATHGAN